MKVQKRVGGTSSMARASSLREQRWVVMNDLQIPFEDKPVLWELVVPFVRELKPYGVVLNGDIVDNHEISDFSKDPKHRRMDLKAERKGPGPSPDGPRSRRQGAVVPRGQPRGPLPPLHPVPCARAGGGGGDAELRRGIPSR